MKAKYAAQIRAGIHLARMSIEDRARTMLLNRHSQLTWRAYLREDRHVFERMIHPNSRCWRGNV